MFQPNSLAGSAACGCASWSVGFGRTGTARQMVRERLEGLGHAGSDARQQGGVWRREWSWVTGKCTGGERTHSGMAAWGPSNRMAWGVQAGE